MYDMNAPINEYEFQKYKHPDFDWSTAPTFTDKSGRVHSIPDRNYFAEKDDKPAYYAWLLQHQEWMDKSFYAAGREAAQRDADHAQKELRSTLSDQQIAEAKTRAWVDYQTDWGLWPTEEEKQARYNGFLNLGSNFDNWHKYV